jgi:hypothetical protein
MQPPFSGTWNTRAGFCEQQHPLDPSFLVFSLLLSSCGGFVWAGDLCLFTADSCRIGFALPLLSVNITKAPPMRLYARAVLGL